MELRNRVESLYLKQETITNLLTILDSHFQKKRLWKYNFRFIFQKISMERI